MRSIETLDVLSAPEWDELVAGIEGELFLTRRWMRCLARAFDLHFEAVVERETHGLVGGIPYVRVRDMRGDRIVVLPFSDMAPPPIVGLDQWLRLVEPLMRYGVPITVCAPSGVAMASDERFKVDTTAVRQVIDLDAELPELMLRMSSQPRRHIRRAEREGIVFRPAESRDHLRDFYDLHLQVRKHRYRLLCQPFSLFEAIWDEFLSTDNGCLLLGFDGDTVVGGCLLLIAGDSLCYKYAASHAEYRSRGASHGAVAGAMAVGLERGMARLDLGRSDTAQPGLIDFKRRFGATASDLSRFTWAPDHYQPDVASTEIVTSLSKLLTSADVPDSVTEQAGNLLYKVFA